MSDNGSGVLEFLSVKVEKYLTSQIPAQPDLDHKFWGFHLFDRRASSPTKRNENGFRSMLSMVKMIQIVVTTEQVAFHVPAMYGNRIVYENTVGWVNSSPPLFPPLSGKNTPKEVSKREKTWKQDYSIPSGRDHRESTN